jgi:hypothetical protein
MKLLAPLIIASVLALSACATVFENTVSCTLDNQKMIFTSWYQNLGVSAKVRKEDSKACEKPVEAAVVK